MNRLFKCYHILNTLSLDVAIGAIVSAVFVAKVLGVDINSMPIICLGLSVWVIYSADHLLDARRINGSAATYRHRFHQQNFKLITIIFGFVICIVFALLFFIKKPILISGSILALFVLLYLLLQHRLPFLKEFIGAVLYTAGILIPTVPFSQHSTSHHALVIITTFALTALINLILFSWFDRDRDRVDNLASLAVRIGIRPTEIILFLLFGLQFCLVMFYTLRTEESSMAIGIISLMNGILFILFKKPEWFKLEDGYRIAGDAVFIIPLVYIFHS